MKIAIVCANGKAGTLITAEALNRDLTSPTPSGMSAGSWRHRRASIGPM